jgi:hypothetical protein
MSYHDDARSFSGVAAVASTEQALTGSGEPARVSVALVSEDFFEVMGVRPVLGRSFHREENRPDRNAAVLVSHGFWRQELGGGPSVIGTDLLLNGIARRVVGVLPPQFDFPGDREVYYPLAYNSTFSSTTAEGRRGEYLQVVARLAPGVSIEQPRAEVHGISDRLQREFPQTNSENIDLSLVPLRDELMGDVDIRPAIFATHAQFPTRTMTIVARTTGDPLSVTGPIRAELSAIDPALPPWPPPRARAGCPASSSAWGRRTRSPTSRPRWRC